MAVVAFRKSLNGSLFSLLVRLRTASKYTHCELVLEGDLGEKCLCFGSNWTDGGVRIKRIRLDPEEWDVVEVDADDSLWEYAMSSKVGAKYDWFGVLFWGTPWDEVEHRKRWFCSEICAHMLGLDRPWKYSPGSLHRHLKKIAR